MEISLKDLLISIWRSKFLIIVSALIGAVLLGSYTYFLVSPQYTATAKMYVYNEKSELEVITASDIAVSKSLVETYLVIVRSDPVLEETAKRLKGTYSTITKEEINGMLDGAAINETETFYISAKCPNPQKAQDVVNTIIEIAPSEIMRVVKAASVEVIEKAELPGDNEKAWPLTRNIAIGFILGFALATAYVVVVNSLDTTIYGRNDIETNFKAPIIGAIPVNSESTKFKKRSFFKRNEVQDLSGVRQNVILNENTPFPVSEAFRMARTNIFYLPTEKPCKKFVVTSAIASEGKSTCGVNLSITLAQAGKKVLLIEADIRRPRVARYLGMVRHKGLSEYLAGLCDDINILRNTRIGVDVILSGTPSSLAAELLETSRIDKLLSSLENEYDYIIIDTPPVNVVTDSTVLSSKVDGYILVMRAGMSDINEVKAAMGALEQVNAKILGLIVTNIDPKLETYGKYSRYGQYYRKHYYGKKGNGYGYGKNAKYKYYADSEEFLEEEEKKNK